MVLWGYIDDSGDGGDILTLSCLIADSPAWYFLGLEWEKFIENKNRELVAKGRSPITRFHAADCSSRLGEFRGWTTKEDQIPFMQGLLSLMEKYQFDVVAYTIDLKQLVKNVPASKPNPRAFGHVLLLHYIMEGIAQGSLKNNKDAIISIIHDRGAYDSVLLDAFNILIDDEVHFAAAKRLGSITPMSWEQCIPLQQADFLAYENYKESRRSLSQRDRRKSLDWILNRGKMGGFLKGFNDKSLGEFRAWFEGIDTRIQEKFLQAARIPIKNKGQSMKTNPEYEKFSTAMDTILRADPKAVKEAMEAEARIHAEERAAKGERKRGKKKAGDKKQ
jgi:hypothetical protein